MPRMTRKAAINLAILVAVYMGLIALPHFLSFSQKEILVFLVINVLLVVSYRVLTLTGEWSLAHVVIMGVGAYGSALCSKELGVPVPLSMLLGAGCAALIAFLLSFPLFRMKGFYFLIGSFAAGEVIRLCWKKFREPFGGPKGLKRIDILPDLDLGSVTIPFFDPVNYYYFCLIVVSISLFLLYRLEHSRLGLTFHAIHWQDKLAESVGINTWRYRSLAFMTASFFAGLAGALLVHYLGTTNPNQFDVNQMVYVLIWVIVGGTATFFGPILGVVTLTTINEVVLRYFELDLWRPMFYGVVLIVFIRYLPAGLESIPARLRSWTNPAGSGGEAGPNVETSEHSPDTAQ